MGCDSRASSTVTGDAHRRDRLTQTGRQTDRQTGGGLNTTV